MITYLFYLLAHPRLYNLVDPVGISRNPSLSVAYIKNDSLRKISAVQHWSVKSVIEYMDESGLLFFNSF